MTVPNRFALAHRRDRRRHRGARRMVSRFRPAGRARARARRARFASPYRRPRICRWRRGIWTGFAASLDAAAAPDLDAALERRRTHDRAVLERAIAADPVFADGARLGHAAGAGDRSVRHRPAAARLARRALGHRRLSVVRRLGPRHDDLAARAVPGDRPLRRPPGRSSKPSPALSTAACCPTSFPAPARRPNTTPPTPACGTSRRGAPMSRRPATRRRCAGPFRCWPRSSTGTSRAPATASRVDPADGLLRAGEPGIQLTWMDARVGDRVVTPRIGKPVEINALWYNALVAMAAHGRAGSALPAERYRAAAEKARQGFARFVRPGGRGPLRCPRRPGGADASLRPNQVFAVSLPASPLDPAAQRAVLRALRRRARHLLRSALAGAERARPIAASCRGAVDRARRRLSPGHGVGLAARPLGAGALSRAWRRRPRRSAFCEPIGDHLVRCRARPGQRDLRRRPAAHAARLPGAGLVGRLRARSLVAARTRAKSRSAGQRLRSRAVEPAVSARMRYSHP